MSWFLLVVLSLSCFTLLGWGLLKRENLYQYPFLVGSLFSILILPQAVSLFTNKDDTSYIQVSSESLNRMLIMSILCLLCSSLGYLIPIPKQYLLKQDFHLSPRKLIKISILYVAAGILFSLYISRNVGYAVDGTSTGIITILIFFLRGFLYLGLPIVLAYSFKEISARTLLLLPFALSVPVYQAIFLGRRSSLFTVVMAIILALFFSRRLLINRSTVCLGIVAALIINVNITAYRSYLISGQVTTLQRTSFIENSIGYFTKPQASLELRNAILLADYSVSQSAYGLGTLYWDRLIFYFFPAQLLGAEQKQSLQFGITPGRDELTDQFSYVIPYGTTNTAMGEAFTQFDYFGCLLFALFAWLCKVIWFRMIVWNSPFLLAVYFNLIQSSTLGALISGHSLAIASIVNIVVFSVPIVLCASRRKPQIIPASAY